MPFRFGSWGPRAILPTPGEAFVQERFGAAIAFACGDWQAFDAQFTRVDPTTFSLAQRISAFMAGPIGAALEERFPEIAALGAEADALTEMAGNTQVIFNLIVGEAVMVAGGGTRGEVRAALSG